MKPKSAREVASALQRKGFQPEQSHHTYYHFRFEGRDIGISTRISRGETEIDRSLLGQMKRQLKFKSSMQFERFIDCPMSERDYIDYLRSNGLIRED